MGKITRLFLMKGSKPFSEILKIDY